MPVLLVHGMAGDASFWQPVVSALDPARRVVVPELRGHGRSAMAADGNYSIDANASDLIAMIDQLGIDRCAVVGHSFGASVAIELAARVPDRIAGLMVVDGAGDFSELPPGTLDGFIAGLESDDHFLDTVDGAIDVALDGACPETELKVRAAMLAAPWPLVRSIYHALLAYRPTRSLDRYHGPVLLVTAPANAASFALHALRPHLARHAVPDVSHWIMMDDPIGFAGVLGNFLDTLPS